MGLKTCFSLQTKEGTKNFQFNFSYLYIIGFSGRDQEKVLEHVKELKEIGVSEEFEEVPVIFPGANTMVTNTNKIQVVEKETSGEAEFAIIIQDNEIYIGLCSDHTDRQLEKVSILKCKQACPKPIADIIWKYKEVKDHWDSLELRAWITVDGKEKLYQEGKVDSILPVEDIIKKVKEKYGDLNGSVIYSGTIPTIDGLVFGDKFKYELTDNVLGRKIVNEYSVELLKYYP